MKIIINNSSMVPIYEQLMEQIKTMILNEELKISALTVKKAYDNLEQEGFTVTVHGKGTYVAAGNNAAKAEERRRELETDLENIIQKGKRYGISNEDIRSMFEMIMEDEEEC